MTDDDRQRVREAQQQIADMTEVAIKNKAPGRYLAGVSIRFEKGRTKVAKVIREASTEH